MKLNILMSLGSAKLWCCLIFLEVDVMNEVIDEVKKDAVKDGWSEEQVEKIREDVRSLSHVLLSNQIELTIALDEMRDRIKPLGVNLSDNEIMGMTERDFMDLIDYKTGAREKQPVKYHYEKQDVTCKAGDILHNTNGSDYRVLEKYSDSNMLLQSIQTGAFMGWSFSERFPNRQRKR